MRYISIWANIVSIDYRIDAFDVDTLNWMVVL